jgi:hypothetical protein
MWDPAKFHGGEAAASRKYDRSNPGRYKGAPAAKRFTMTDKTPDQTATARKAFDEGARKNQYVHGVRTLKARAVRG